MNLMKRALMRWANCLGVAEQSPSTQKSIPSRPSLLMTLRVELMKVPSDYSLAKTFFQVSASPPPTDIMTFLPVFFQFLTKLLGKRELSATRVPLLLTLAQARMTTSELEYTSSLWDCPQYSPLNPQQQLLIVKPLLSLSVKPWASTSTALRTGSQTDIVGITIMGVFKQQDHYSSLGCHLHPTSLSCSQLLITRKNTVAFALLSSQHVCRYLQSAYQAGSLRSQRRLPSQRMRETKPYSLMSATSYYFSVTPGMVMLAEVGKVSSCASPVNMLSPVMVILDAPDLAALVEAFVTRQGTPLMTQSPPFLTEPACAWQSSPSSRSPSVIVEYNLQLLDDQPPPN